MHANHGKTPTPHALGAQGHLPPSTHESDPITTAYQGMIDRLVRIWRLDEPVEFGPSTMRPFQCAERDAFKALGITQPFSEGEMTLRKEFRHYRNEFFAEQLWQQAILVFGKKSNLLCDMSQIYKNEAIRCLSDHYTGTALKKGLKTFGRALNETSLPLKPLVEAAFLLRALAQVENLDASISMLCTTTTKPILTGRVKFDTLVGKQLHHIKVNATLDRSRCKLEESRDAVQSTGGAAFSTELQTALEIVSHVIRYNPKTITFVGGNSRPEAEIDVPRSARYYVFRAASSAHKDAINAVNGIELYTQLFTHLKMIDAETRGSDNHVCVSTPEWAAVKREILRVSAASVLSLGLDASDLFLKHVGVTATLIPSKGVEVHDGRYGDSFSCAPDTRRFQGFGVAVLARIISTLTSSG